MGRNPQWLDLISQKLRYVYKTLGLFKDWLQNEVFRKHHASQTQLLRASRVLGPLAGKVFLLSHTQILSVAVLNSHHQVGLQSRSDPLSPLAQTVFVLLCFLRFVQSHSVAQAGV